MEQVKLFDRIINSQQGTGMSHIYLSVLKGYLYFGREFEQSYVVGYCGPFLPILALNCSCVIL